jgi:hypothetical protein
MELGFYHFERMFIPHKKKPITLLRSEVSVDVSVGVNTSVPNGSQVLVDASDVKLHSLDSSVSDQALVFVWPSCITSVNEVHATSSQ